MTIDPAFELMARALGVSVEQLELDIEARKRAAQRRAQQQNARYDAALAEVTAAQRATIDALVREGARQQSRLRQNAQTGRVVIFLQKTAFDSRRGRMGTKLFAVYPNGTRAETFVRSISVRPNF